MAFGWREGGEVRKPSKWGGAFWMNADFKFEFGTGRAAAQLGPVDMYN